MAAGQRELPDTAPDTVYINLIARELLAISSPDTVAHALASSGLSPHHWGSRSLSRTCPTDPGTLHPLRQLHERGHQLSVDDFGTGYSSLSRLVDLPVDLAKIDKSFVASLPEQHRWSRFVDGVLHLAGTLDLQVIAEGVETSAQADHLTRARFHLLQGHHLGRPPSPPTSSQQAGASPSRHCEAPLSGRFRARPPGQYCDLAAVPRQRGRSPRPTSRTPADTATQRSSASTGCGVR